MKIEEAYPGEVQTRIEEVMRLARSKSDPPSPDPRDEFMIEGVGEQYVDFMEIVSTASESMREAVIARLQSV